MKKEKVHISIKMAQKLVQFKYLFLKHHLTTNFYVSIVWQNQATFIHKDTDLL